MEVMEKMGEKEVMAPMLTQVNMVVNLHKLSPVMEAQVETEAQVVMVVMEAMEDLSLLHYFKTQAMNSTLA